MFQATGRPLGEGLVPGCGTGVEQGDRGAGGMVDGGGGRAVPVREGEWGVEGREDAGGDAEEGVDQLGLLKEEAVGRVGLGYLYRGRRR